MDPTTLYSLLVLISARGEVVPQKPIPPKLFREIVNTSGPYLYAVALHRKFILFSVADLTVTTQPPFLKPNVWITFDTRDDAITKGVNLALASGLAGRLSY